MRAFLKHGIRARAAVEGEALAFSSVAAEWADTFRGFFCYGEDCSEVSRTVDTVRQRFKNTTGSADARPSLLSERCRHNTRSRSKSKDTAIFRVKRASTEEEAPVAAETTAAGNRLGDKLFPLRRGEKSNISEISNRRAPTLFAMKKSMHNITEQAKTEAAVMHDLFFRRTQQWRRGAHVARDNQRPDGRDGRPRRTGEAMNSGISTVDSSDRKRRTKTEILPKSSRDCAVAGSRLILLMIRTYTRRVEVPGLWAVITDRGAIKFVKRIIEFQLRAQGETATARYKRMAPMVWNLLWKVLLPPERLPKPVTVFWTFMLGKTAALRRADGVPICDVLMQEKKVRNSAAVICRIIRPGTFTTLGADVGKGSKLLSGCRMNSRCSGDRYSADGGARNTRVGFQGGKLRVLRQRGPRLLRRLRRILRRPLRDWRRGGQDLRRVGG